MVERDHGVILGAACHGRKKRHGSPRDLVQRAAFFPAESRLPYHGVAVGVSVGLGVRHGVHVAVALGVGLGVRHGVHVAVAVGVGLGVRHGVHVAVAVAVGVGVNVAVAAGVNVGVGVGTSQSTKEAPSNVPPGMLSKKEVT